MKNTKTDQDNGKANKSIIRQIFGNDISLEDEPEIETAANIEIQQKLGVLQTAINVPKTNKEYRQLLYLGNFRNEKQAMLYAGSLAFCRKYKSKLSEDFFLDRIAALNGVESERLRDILFAMNTFNVNRVGNSKKSFWNRRQNKDGLTDD